MSARLMPRGSLLSNFPAQLPQFSLQKPDAPAKPIPPEARLTLAAYLLLTEPARPVLNQEKTDCLKFLMNLAAAVGILPEREHTSETPSLELVPHAANNSDNSDEQRLTDISPAKGFCQGIIKELNECQNATFEFFDGREVAAFEQPAGQNTKPHFHLVEP